MLEHSYWKIKRQSLTRKIAIISTLKNKVDPSKKIAKEEYKEATKLTTNKWFK